MNDFLSTNGLYVVIGAVLTLALLWWFLLANRKTRVTVDRRDTLDEGAAPAARNQALIDAAPVAGEAVVVPAVPGAIGGAGAAVAAAAGSARERQDTAQELTQIKGLGPKLATTLNELGVTSLAQIAAWTDSDIDRIDGQLGRFQGRIRRDRWVEQARLLEEGDRSSYEAQFGAQ
ncbi:helix-hairpin-helix domain-containing protein [Tsuneonella amylolytica]|uniref:helix-hairpin-helix domain-containing protein n=1 Tax=Tsuneonella amylolytica TaxID=2338327 RepID=UPI000EAA1770|nr:helix-hairpin-helix domain-containing protein [Tsuneonella amylolytica]